MMVIGFWGNKERNKRTLAKHTNSKALWREKNGRQVRETPGKYLSPALNVGQLDFCSGIYR